MARWAGDGVGWAGAIVVVDVDLVVVEMNP